MTSDDADVVVVGGGHNGLVAACYLAKAGHRVALVEAAPQLGGLSTSGPLIPEAPEHIVHPAALDLMMIRRTSIISDLGLERHGFRMIEAEPAYGYLHPGGESVMFWRDPARTARDISVYSADDAKAYLEYAKVLDALLAVSVPMMRADPLRPAPREVARAARGLVRHRRQMSDLVTLATGTAESIAHEYFTHPATLGAILGLAGGTVSPNVEGSGLALILPAILHRIGVGRVQGGIQRLINALAASLVEAGGKVFTGSPVEEILVQSGRTTGVRLADGRVLRSDAVLTSCDPRTTFERLLPADAVDRRTRTRASFVPANALGCDVMKIDLALSGRVRFPHHPREDGLDLRKPLVVLGTEQETAASFTSSQRGELPSAPLLWVANPTGHDPSQAPPDQDVVYIYPAAVPRDPDGGWPAAKDDMAKRAIGQAGRFMDGLERLEIGRYVETPHERSERAGTTNGTFLHVDFGLLRSGPLRPAWGLGGYKTPVEGLYLGGSGSHPSGSVTGLPGQLSSRHVDRFLRKRPA
jgi:phytoene dehydrogenase-like protein